MPTPDPADLAEARAQGAAAARETMTAAAPTDPVLRIAWVSGFGNEVDLRAAVSAAREAGVTWATIAAALDQNMRTVMTKFGGGYDSQRRYRERKRREN
ncbi:MAG: hypothetical protein AB7H92_14115 [Microbacteriaceae bacterium]